MALSAPPFAQQNASHSAALFRQAASAGRWPAHGVLGYNDFYVAAQSTPNMSVQVNPGQAWVQGSSVGTISGIGVGQQGSYYALSDTSATLSIAAADPTNPRIDVVYLRVLDTAYGDGSNTAILGVVTGTPASSPAVPALPANALDLAHVRVNANVTSITNSVISFSSRVSGGLNVPQASSVGSAIQVGTEATLPGLAASNPAWGQMFLAGDSYNLYCHAGQGAWLNVSNLGKTGVVGTVYQNTAQAGNAANAFITLTLSGSAQGAMGDGIGLVVPTYGAGYWLIDGMAAATNFGTTSAQFSTWVTINGTFPAASGGSRVLSTGSGTSFQTAASLGARVMFLNANDQIRLVASANTTWDANNTASNVSSWLSAMFLGGSTRVVS